MEIVEGVSLPQGLIDAHARGNLVIFVGAGASMGAPSNLPSFEGLARQLARLAAHRFNKARGLDAFIGSLESLPGGFDVHRHARKLIAKPGSQPNPTHNAIVELASTCGALRIVTTNYDTHLSDAAKALGVRVQDTWFGPALPRGRDFEGIVHLHGSILRPERELILTDGDFGAAYLADAWATRFLLSMFAQYTVLFVGYSHEDAIMRYLSLGLPSADAEARRFALTNEPSDAKWAYLGIEAIGYPNEDGDHSRLSEALSEWAALARMGRQEHLSRMKKIVGTGLRPETVANDYVLSRMKTTDGVADFVTAVSEAPVADRLQWLVWVEDVPEFMALFARGVVPSASGVFSRWFTSEFMASPDLTSAALSTVQRLGQTWSDVLFRDACWAVEELASRDATLARPWKALLGTSIKGQTAPVDTAGLLPFDPGDRPEHRTVLRVALTPRLRLEKAFGLGRGVSDVHPRGEIVWDWDHQSLSVHLAKAIETSPPGDPSLGNILEESLAAAYDLRDAYDGPDRWDPLSYGRSAIEPHEQDDLREPVDALINALRDYGEQSLEVRPELPDRWWAMEGSLFRRLALHLVAHDGSRGPDEKVHFLLERELLYETDLKHEVFQVLAQNAQGASITAKRELLAEVLRGPNYPHDWPDHERHTNYTIYNLLHWLHACAPLWKEVEDATRSVAQENPTFAPREHPDLDHWGSSGSWGGVLPMEPEEFTEKVAKDPAEALRSLLERDYSERNFEDPTWEDALRLVSKAAGENPGTGLKVWSELEKLGNTQSRVPELLAACVDGWADCDLGAQADPVLARVRELVKVPDSVRAVSGFLVNQATKGSIFDEVSHRTMLALTAGELWRAYGESYDHGRHIDPLSIAPLYLNSWPGDVARFWILEIDSRHRAAGSTWEGLDDQEASALRALLAGPAAALDAIEPALAAQVAFLFAVDREFTVTHVLPLFADRPRAVFAWHSFLHRPTVSKEILEAGFFEALLSLWPRLDLMKERGLRSNFLRLVCIVVSLKGVKASWRKRLLDASVLAANGAHSVAFAAEVVNQLNNTDPAEGHRVWRQWLRGHVRKRLDGVPRGMGTSELAHWADTVPLVGSGLPEALALFTGRGAGIAESFRAPSLAPEVVQSHGVALVDFYSERLRNTDAVDFTARHGVNNLINDLREGLGDEAVESLARVARDRGLRR